MSEILYKDLSYEVQGAFYEVYKEFRNVHKEIVYHNALMKILKDKNLTAEKNKRIDIKFRGIKVGTYVPDIIVNDSIVIELKCKPHILRSDIVQFWHYLKTSDYKVGYLVNFGKPDGAEIIRRIYDTMRQK
ncbi:GxxExxY protein [Candidatus Parcubacteria bacterium]|nr:GxxExxY protein [Candidatus Parcubacteria bacterium]